MKRIILSTIVATSICSGCHAENNQTVKNRVTTNNQADKIIQPKVSLNCQDFELEHGDYLVCNYWQKSNRLNKNIDLKNFTRYHEINFIRDLSPSDYAFHATTELTFDNIKYNAYIYPNSRITLENPNKKVKSEIAGGLVNESIEYICQNPKCEEMFLWEYVDDGMADQYPQIEKKSSFQQSTLLESLIEKSNNKDIKNIQQKGKLTVKVGLKNIHKEKRQYVFRNVSPTTPLKEAIQAYLDGATAEEVKLGYQTDNLGINKFDVKINNKVANIAFFTDNLHIKDEQEIIDFNYNIEMTARQFDSVKDVKICIKGISNYQNSYFGYEPKKKCEF